MKSLALRVFLWLLAKVFYQVTVLHPEDIAGQGGALLVSNHRSYVDMLLILASSRKPREPLCRCFRSLALCLTWCPTLRNLAT